jgi:putative membrane protein
MIISHKVSLFGVIISTWKHFILTVAISFATYLLFDLFNKPQYVIPTFVPSIIGTALAFFIGFNNNQAYDRWWVARKIWGALVNDSRSWTRQLIFFSNNSKDHPDIKKMIYRHISFLYALHKNYEILLRMNTRTIYQKRTLYPLLLNLILPTQYSPYKQKN